MADFNPTAIADGYELKAKIKNAKKVMRIRATSPRLDRGQIRATLTVLVGEVIHFRDTANLTSGRARARVLADLKDKKLAVDERMLVALDEACRRPRPRRETTPHDGGSDVSETPALSLTDLRARFGARLLIRDRDLLTVIAAAVLAHRFDAEPVWLMVVAPPGGTKTEPLRALFGAPGIYPLSELTPRTFASGLDVPGGDPSLLARLTSEVLVLKDFTTVLEMRREDRQAILAQLREIYDGRFDKAWGTGRELHWEGRLGFVAGVTPIIDKHQAAMAVLGERFVLFRTQMPDRRALARAALRSRGCERAMREELAIAMRGFLGARGTEPPALGPDALEKLATVADFVTRARSGVQRDGYRRELEYAPEPEAPTRFAKVLASLAAGVALAHDRPEVADEDLALVLRVALDCLPVIRQRVITALVEGAIADEGDDGRLSTTKIAGASQFSGTAIRRALEDLQALDVVVCHKAGSGKADNWTLSDPWRDVFATLVDAAKGVCDAPPDGSETVGETFSETSTPPSHANGNTPSPHSDTAARAAAGGRDGEPLEPDTEVL